MAGGLWRKKWLLEHEVKVAYGVQNVVLVFGNGSLASLEFVVSTYEIVLTTYNYIYKQKTINSNQFSTRKRKRQQIIHCFHNINLSFLSGKNQTDWFLRSCFIFQQ